MIPAVSLRDNLGFNLAHAITTALPGTFTRSRFWVPLGTRVRRDPMAVRRVRRLRLKDQSDHLFLRLGTTRGRCGDTVLRDLLVDGEHPATLVVLDQCRQAEIADRRQRASRAVRGPERELLRDRPR